jgi:hypothetical protein
MVDKRTLKERLREESDGGRREHARDGTLLDEAEQKDTAEVGPRQTTDPTADQPDLEAHPSDDMAEPTGEDQVDEATAPFGDAKDAAGLGDEGDDEVGIHDPTDPPELRGDPAEQRADLLGSADTMRDPLLDILGGEGEPDPTRGADLRADDGSDGGGGSGDPILDKARADLAEIKATMADIQETGWDTGDGSGGGGGAGADGSGGADGTGGDTYVMERGGKLSDGMSDEGFEGFVKWGLDKLTEGKEPEPVYRNTRTDELVDAEDLPEGAKIEDGRSTLEEVKEHPDNDTGVKPEPGRTLWGDIKAWFAADDEPAGATGADVKMGDGEPSGSIADDHLLQQSDVLDRSPLLGQEESEGDGYEESDEVDADHSGAEGAQRPGGESAPDDPVAKAHFEEQRQRMLDLVGYRRTPPRSGTVDPIEDGAPGEAEGGHLPPGLADPPEGEEAATGSTDGEAPMGQPGAIDPSEEQDTEPRSGLEEDVPEAADVFDDGETLTLPGTEDDGWGDPDDGTESLREQVLDDGVDVNGGGHLLDTEPPAIDLPVD